jgi:hypothetical protein
MKKGRLQKLFLTISVVMILLFIPIAAFAQIQWNTQQYTAFAYGFEHDGYDPGPVTQYGPPLPVSASANYSSKFVYFDVNSTITNSTIDLHVYKCGSLCEANVSAEFLGTYTATSSSPLFQFDYSLAGDVSGRISRNYFLTVYDLTDSTSIYSNSALQFSNTPVTINVPTTAGHEISVNFKLSNYFGTYAYPETNNTSMTYNMAAAPEPISSILFVTGGTLLAGRRYLKSSKERKRGSSEVKK